jgi:c-di-GMP-binding flagellar brake protein YcgR
MLGGAVPTRLIEVKWLWHPLVVKQAPGVADNSFMGAWLTKVVHALRGQTLTRKMSREALVEAQRAAIKLELNIQGASGAIIAHAPIEAVRDDDFVISQPMVDRTAYMLAFGENVRISFLHASRYVTGETRCLGRMKIARTDGGQRQTVPGYRLALPDELQMVERRKHSRTLYHLRHPIEARLHSPSFFDGVAGDIVDLSIGGARMVLPPRSRNMVPGETMYLKMMLPPPGGLIDELVKVVRVEIDPASGSFTLGLRFEKDQRELEKLFRGLARPV